MHNLKIFVDLASAPEVLDMLRQGTAGHELIFPQTQGTSVLGQAGREARFVEADVAFGQPDPAAVTEAPNLKLIQISSSGITRYDNPSFRALVAERGIAVCNSASVYSEPCALHALSFILAQARRLPQALDAKAAAGSQAWDALRGSCTLLRGQTVLIVGYGAIGARLAEMLSPLGVRILAYRRQARGDEAVPVITPKELPEVLAQQADHIIDILPASAATRHFFDAARFAMVKPGSVFYNIGRGATVDQEALVQALRSGPLAAAWLDVTDPEPLPVDHPLRNEPNCFITPHIAGGHAGEAKTLVGHFLDNFQRFVHGQALVDRVM